MSTKKVENRITKKLHAALTEPVLQPPERVWKAIEREVNGTKVPAPKVFVKKWDFAKFFQMLPLFYIEKKIFVGTLAATVILAFMQFQSIPIENTWNNQVAWSTDSFLKEASSKNTKNAITSSYQMDPDPAYYRDKQFVTNTIPTDFRFPAMATYLNDVEKPYDRQQVRRSGNRGRHSGRSIHRRNSVELRKVSYRSSQ